MYIFTMISTLFKLIRDMVFCMPTYQVLVKNVPYASGRSISDSVEIYFKKNHPDHYLCHQVILGTVSISVDSF